MHLFADHSFLVHFLLQLTSASPTPATPRSLPVMSESTAAIRFSADSSPSPGPSFGDSWTWWPSVPASDSYKISDDGRNMTVTTASGQDWWRKPGHDAHNGKLILCIPTTYWDHTNPRNLGPAFVRSLASSKLGSDFEASVAVAGEWKQLFDQGTIFLHMTDAKGETRWVKAGVEREDDIDWIGSVVTTVYSDWTITAPTSSANASLSSHPVTFSLTRIGHQLNIRASSSKNAIQYRRDVNGFFDSFEAKNIRTGVMACQPAEDAQGVKVTFSDFRFQYK